MTTNLNLDYMRARKLIVPTMHNINLILVGCGGTGSWLAPAVARYARMLIEYFDREVTVIFIDPDKVEAKNVYRQNFCDAEIGAYKAQTLATRFSLAWGIPISAHNEAFTQKTRFSIHRSGDEVMTVVIGCVDQTRARKEILGWAEMSRKQQPIWWLDCGNKKTVGQVLLGRKLEDGEQPLVLDGLCTWLPLPSAQHPELVEAEESAEPTPEPSVDETRLSCAELAMRGSQSLSINFRMASIAGEMLGKFLLTSDLENFAVYVNEATGEIRKFITDEAIAQWLTVPSPR